MPTKHPKLLITVTDAQRKQLAHAAQKRHKPVSELIRDALIAANLMRPDDEIHPYGGLRQVWTCDDDIAIITTTHEGKYQVDITYDDWDRHFVTFETLDESQEYLRRRNFSP